MNTRREVTESELHVIITGNGLAVDCATATSTQRIAFGLTYACCDDHCRHERCVFVGSVKAIGQMVADILTYAEHHGQAAALSAAIDQGRAAARQMLGETE